MITKLISGGQTGADRTALEVAESLGIPTGGWAPAGWRTDAGPAPELGTRFGLREHVDRNYRGRTYANVRDSDATIWFGDRTSPGGQCTWTACLLDGKIMYINPAAEELAAAIVDQNWEVLNIAGNRARTNPAVVAQVRFVLTQALQPTTAPTTPAPPSAPLAPLAPPSPRPDDADPA